MSLEWNEGNDAWQARGPVRPNNQIDENYEDDQDLDDDGDLDGDDDDALGFGPAQQPANWNPHPVRVMGQGNRHIVLHNDQRSAAHLVMEVLRRVFGKDMQECHYIMSDAHYNGRAKVFQCADDAEAQRYLDQIDVAKQDIANSGALGADTLDQLQFTVEVA
jgi:ATP-dependent Clp protease adapter protein ClpS